jgi:hypothetical protein
MRRRIFASLTATAAVTASLLISSAAPAAAQTATTDSSATARGGSGGVTPNEKLPVDIQVNATTNKIVTTLRGVGVQVYTCGADGKFPASPREPVATLEDARGRAVGIHGKGPFWAGFDGSKVVGTAIKAVPSPAGPANVTWVKLSGASELNAPGLFGNVSFVQRIDSKGGAAPTAGCTPGSTKAVDYSTNYVFWSPK